MSQKRQAPKKRFYHRQHSIRLDMNTVNGVTEQFVTARKILPTHRRLLSALWRV